MSAAAVAQILRERAAARNPGLGGARLPVGYTAPQQFNPRPQMGGGSVMPEFAAPAMPTPAMPSVTGSGLTSRQIVELAERPSKSSGGSNGLSWLANTIGQGFMTGLNVVDAGRRMYQAAAGEVGDLVSNIPNVAGARGLVNTVVGNPFQLRSYENEDGTRDQSFNAGKIWDAAVNEDMGSGGFNARSEWTQSLPGVLKPVVGFAGDVLTDPTTYVSAGAVSLGADVAEATAKTAVRQAAERMAASPYVGAAVKSQLPEEIFNRGGQYVVRSAARESMAKEVARIATDVGIEPALKEKLVANVGKYGRGGLTDRALAKIGTSADELLAQGLVVPKFRTTVGVGSARFSVPGSAKAAARWEEAKGVVKAFTADSAAGRLTRRLFTSSKHSQNVLKQAILTGSPNSYTAAALLSALERGRGDSFKWMNLASHELKQLEADGVKLKGLHGDASKALTAAVEAADWSNPLAKGVADFFAKTADDLINEYGVDLGGRRLNYMPHRLSEDAIKHYRGGGEDEIRKFVGTYDDALNRTERFQNFRATDESIAEVNARWRASGHNFDLLETDAHSLITSYLEETQRAIMDAAVSTSRKYLGDDIVREVSRGVDPGKVEKAVGDLLDTQAKHVRDAVEKRTDAARKAEKALKGQKAEAASKLDAAKKELADYEGRAVKLQEKVDKATVRLQELQDAEAIEQQVLKKASAKEKSAGTKRIKALQAERAVLEADLVSAQDALAKMPKGKKGINVLRQNVKDAEKAVLDFDPKIEFAEAQRAAMEANPISQEAKAAKRNVAKAAEKTVKAVEKVGKATSEFDAASNTVGWQRATVQEADDALARISVEVDDWVERATASKGKNNAWKKPQKKMDALLEQRDLLRERISEVRDLLQKNSDPALEPIIKLEAQAAEADAKALMAGMKANRLRGEFDGTITDQFGKALDLMSEVARGTPTGKRFQSMVVDQVDEGFSLIRTSEAFGADLQMQTWAKEAYEQTGQFAAKARQDWGKLSTFMKKWRGAMNWWKGWALSSPGMVVRNLYTGLFGMYLDNINPGVAARFSLYSNKVLRMGEDAANDWARRKWGARAAENLVQANRVAAASGWGITAEEFSRDLVGKSVSFNPLSSKNPYSAGVRRLSSEAEVFMRGGHAFAVLQRGGSFEDALQRVQKFHFNYRDISEFDRAMKDIQPFWTFWSRNLALQTSVYAKQPQKITKSYYNAKRNIEDQIPEGAFPGVVPQYLSGPQSDMNAIGTQFGGAGGGQMFLAPDIPSAKFPAQVAGMVDSLSGGGNPLDIVMENAGPAFKIPYQALTNRDTFTDREYRNSQLQMTANGLGPRMAPFWMQAPGVGDLASLLPGVERTNGVTTMTDKAEMVMENLNPMIGRASRLVPNTDRDRETFKQYALNFFGFPMRWNDPGSQAGELARQRKQAEERANKIYDRLMLEAVTR